MWTRATGLSASLHVHCMRIENKLIVRHLIIRPSLKTQLGSTTPKLGSTTAPSCKQTHRATGRQMGCTRKPRPP